MQTIFVDITSCTSITTQVFVHILHEFLISWFSCSFIALSLLHSAAVVQRWSLVTGMRTSYVYDFNEGCWPGTTAYQHEHAQLSTDFVGNKHLPLHALRFESVGKAATR